MKHYGRPLFRIALIGALAASIGLAACGRKGPLDPPPAASLAGDQAVVAPDPSDRSKPPIGPDGKLIAPGAANKRIPLDVLLN
ncbi:MAG TPA: lipoprotein [Pseudolabrys sp.]|nr:lipoprotein [Pseudolabrys sp.]HXZ22600.1 lipoprotein [Pseudolabrys sp.]